MVFGLFGAKKPSLKLLPKQEVELRYENPGGDYEYCLVRVREVGKKKVILEPVGTQVALRLVPGQPVAVSALVDNTLFSYESSVQDARDREFDLSLPKDVDELQVDTAGQLEVSLPVEFRAMKTSFAQMGNTMAITPTGMSLLTNVPIPPSTSLHLTVSIPASGSEVGLRAKALSSTKLSDSRKAVNELEFEDIDEKDKSTLIRAAVYQHYRKK